MSFQEVQKTFRAGKTFQQVDNSRKISVLSVVLLFFFTRCSERSERGGRGKANGATSRRFVVLSLTRSQNCSLRQQMFEQERRLEFVSLESRVRVATRQQRLLLSSSGRYAS